MVGSSGDIKCRRWFGTPSHPWRSDRAGGCFWSGEQEYSQPSLLSPTCPPAFWYSSAFYFTPTEMEKRHLNMYKAAGYRIRECAHTRFCFPQEEEDKATEGVPSSRRLSPSPRGIRRKELVANRRDHVAALSSEDVLKVVDEPSEGNGCRGGHCRKGAVCVCGNKGK